MTLSIFLISFFPIYEVSGESYAEDLEESDEESDSRNPSCFGLQKCGESANASDVSIILNVPGISGNGVIASFGDDLVPAHVIGRPPGAAATDPLLHDVHNPSGCLVVVVDVDQLVEAVSEPVLDGGVSDPVGEHVGSSDDLQHEADDEAH